MQVALTHRKSGQHRPPQPIAPQFNGRTPDSKSAISRLLRAQISVRIGVGPPIKLKTQYSNILKLVEQMIIQIIWRGFESFKKIVSCRSMLVWWNWQTPGTFMCLLPVLGDCGDSRRECLRGNPQSRSWLNGEGRHKTPC